MRRSSLLLALFLSSTPALSQDTVTIVGRNASAGTTVEVPIYLRDQSGTALGMDRPAGQKIQALGLQVSASQPSAVTSISISRSGVTSALTPLYQATPAGSAGTAAIGFVSSFRESTNPIPLTLDAAGLGNTVAMLTLALAPGLAKGTKISLTLAPSGNVTRLSNQAGTISETPENGALALANGTVSIGPFWGDANLDGTIDVFDVVILAGYIVGNTSPGVAPFLNTRAAMNLDPVFGPAVDLFDLLILASHVVGNVSVLPLP